MLYKIWLVAMRNGLWPVERLELWLKSLASDHVIEKSREMWCLAAWLLDALSWWDEIEELKVGGMGS